MRHKKKILAIGAFTLTTVALLGACAESAAPAAPEGLVEDAQFGLAEEPLAFPTQGAERELSAPEPDMAGDGAAESSADDTTGTVRTSEDTVVGAFQGAERLIIKNAEVHLLVEDTEVAIDRLTQIIDDSGGYIVSSREWFITFEDDNYKNATVTFAVPVDQFERSLRRLREISVRVLDERASGEDVTQEFVDLESRLTNLEATRDRIRLFLEQAQTVEEALRVNQELSAVEQQIEEIKGRMNFLEGRAAFSTITATLEPELPEIVATPTPTPTATPTPTQWTPGETFNQATGTLTTAYQGITELLIWFFVVLVPILAPFVLVGVLIWWVARRLQRKGAE